MWIGIDDTDSTTGMCTTWLVPRIVAAFDEYDLIGLPRLVRLNPNIPWKTRGNGAVCLHFGTGRGITTPACSCNNEVSVAYEQGVDTGDSAEALRRVAAIIERYAVFDDPKTNPGIVITAEKPPQYALYRSAVQRVVTHDEAEQVLAETGAVYKGYGTARGLIGATAALCYAPGDDRTYEFIAYRGQERIGTERVIDAASVRAFDAAHPTTFDTYDADNDVIRIAPNSPCPVLYGVRGDVPADVFAARTLIAAEPVADWALFETNQATDDHIQKKRIADVARYESALVHGTVTGMPLTRSGGHVFVTLADDSGTIDCAAYEPTKQFRDIVRGLRPGDGIDAYGSVGRTEKTLNLEKIAVRRLAQVTEKIANPLCDDCGKRMKSQGAGQDYKCPLCGATAGTSAAVYAPVERTISEQWYDVPVCARRHLSKPVVRQREQKN